MTSISIPNRVTNIGEIAFGGCSSLANVSIPNSVTSIGGGAFSGCSSLTSVSIPNSVTSIGGGAFSSCTKLNDFTIPVGIKKIEDSLFYGCSGLVSVTIPDGVTSIGPNAFRGCRKLKNLSIPAGVNSIGEYAFTLCSTLTRFTIPSGVTRIERHTFENCSSLTRIAIPGGITYIGNNAFRGCSSLSSITIPKSVLSIEYSTFYGCSSLTAITIPDSVTRIYDNAFYGCSSLTSIIIPHNVTNIGYCAFYDCSNLTKATLNSGIKKIERKAFYNCTSLSDIYIPFTVEQISGDAFNYYNKYQEKYEPIVGLTISGYSETKAQNYANHYNIKFKSLGTCINKAKINISSQTYTGKALKPAVVVSVNGTKLRSNTDYSVAYRNNTNAGTASVTVTGIGKNVGNKTASFKINRAQQSITAKAVASSVAVGKSTAVSVTGAKGTKSFKSSDTSVATVSSAGKVTGKKVGTVRITVTSAVTPNYNAASKSVTIKVIPGATTSLTAANQATGIKLTWKKVAGANGYKIYRGSTLIKTITSGNTVTFTDTKANTNGAEYNYKVVAKASTGNSPLSKSLTFYRVARPAANSVSNSALSKMTVKWSNNAKASGYQIQYNISRTFERGNKEVTVPGASTTSKVIGGITKGKTYYIRVRTYKIVGSTIYWSAWSAPRSVKISK